MQVRFKDVNIGEEFSFVSAKIIGRFVKLCSADMKKTEYYTNIGEKGDFKGVIRSCCESIMCEVKRLTRFDALKSGDQFTKEDDTQVYMKIDDNYETRYNAVALTDGKYDHKGLLVCLDCTQYVEKVEECCC